MKNTVLSLLLLLSDHLLFGQSSNSIGLQYINEQIVTAPFAEQSESPAHPGGILSYELLKKDRTVYSFSHTFQLGYFHHQDVNQTVFLAWKPKYEWQFFNLLSIHGMPGLAYVHSFPTQKVYKHDGETYKEANSLGQPHFMPSLGLGFGVSLDRINLPIEIFVRQEYAVLFPNSKRLPISLNSLRSIGIKYSINNRNNDNEL